jgi:hypothetical protein
LLFRARRRLREEYRQAQRSSMGGLTLVQ